MQIAAPLLWVGVLTALTAGAQPGKKQVKDRGEQQLYNQAIQAEDSAARIRALDAWTARYPESDYKDDRLYFYLQAYAKLAPLQPARILEYGRLLLARDPRAVFNTPEGGLIVLNVLFLVAHTTATLPDASPEQLALGQRAAADLLRFLAGYTPPNTAQSEWSTARSDIEKRTRAAAVTLALVPGKRAIEHQPPDCSAASAAYAKAVQEFPGSALAAYSLGKALLCDGKTPQAIFQFFRAAHADPDLAGVYAANLYTAYHGSADGIAAVEAIAKASPFPPADFQIESAAAVAARKQADSTAGSPHLERWQSIREPLAQSYGMQYFEGQLRGTPVSLKGTIVEGRPTCRPKELLVAIVPGGSPEVLLHLDTVPAGMAVPGEIQFTAVPRSFTAKPFLLTMDAHRTRIANLKIGPCAGR